MDLSIGCRALPEGQFHTKTSIRTTGTTRKRQKGNKHIQDSCKDQNTCYSTVLRMTDENWHELRTWLTKKYATMKKMQLTLFKRELRRRMKPLEGERR
ncbi:uncharacterized protein LOC122566070 isoform X2 [Bombus pyrosoma]|uniref:uncharacterized protein LOC122566070 isoform X2 n=1 Tax=Bombus pyrosoma TaxID=396416 RepID=UPI001CB98147|nr:uncharacterized protein LOC122566070 isoform X2 [Bombus pyrosoma]